LSPSLDAVYDKIETLGGTDDQTLAEVLAEGADASKSTTIIM